MTRLNASATRMWKSVLALLALATLLLALWTGPAGAATTFTVNKTGDASDRDLANSRCATSANKGNQCTLRAVIEEANDTSGVDTIEFGIDGSGVKTISPSSPLPEITDTVTIDGYTQDGATENTLEEGSDAVLKVELDGTNAGTNAEGLTIKAADSTIKGLVINRFDGSGIGIRNGGPTDSTGNKIEGNFVGTNTAGTADRGNNNLGVVVSGSDDNTIGGTQPAQRNLISGNDNDGISILNTSRDNTVEGNLIGTAADGIGDLGNADNGVAIGLSSTDNTIGGTEPGAANTISGNGNIGVLVETFNATGNSVLSNSIYDNDDLGIDLGGGGVTENDADDTDASAPNDLQNFPVIGSAIKSSATGFTTITGSLNSNPNQDFLIQCFRVDDPSDGSGHGEGEVLLDTTSRSTDSSGDASFQCDTQEAGLGREVTATATNVSTGDTSEFSESEEVIGAISPP